MPGPAPSARASGSLSLPARTPSGSRPASPQPPGPRPPLLLMLPLSSSSEDNRSSSFSHAAQRATPAGTCAPMLVPPKIYPLGPACQGCYAADPVKTRSTRPFVAIRMGNTTTAWRRLRASSWPRDSGWLALFHPILAARAASPAPASSPPGRSPDADCRSCANPQRRCRAVIGG